MEQQITSTNTAKRIRDALEKIKAVPDDLQSLLGWAASTDLTIKNGMREDPLSGYIGQNPTIKKNDLIDLLEGIVEKKEEYQGKKRAQKKVLNTDGGAFLTGLGKPTKIPLNTSLLKINANDYALFSMIKQCGDSITVRSKDSTILCTEDSKGNIHIPNKEFLKGNIAYEANEDFNNKLRKYVKMTNDFLVDLMDNFDLEKVGLSPIEEFMSTEVPSSLAKLFELTDYVTESQDKKHQHHDLKLKLIEKISNFDDVFQYVLDNWSKFHKCIGGQKKFIAWSNKTDVASVSYWTLPNEEVKCPENWDKYLDLKMDPRMRSRFVWFWGSCLDADSTCQQYLANSDSGGTLKSATNRILSSALPPRAVGFIDDNILNDKNEFGMSASEIWLSHISIIDEIGDSTNLTSARTKRMVAQQPLTLQVKNRSAIEWEPINHKLIVNSNKGIVVKDYANRRRIIPICFKSITPWSKEWEDDLRSTVKQFLDYAYCYYKRCPLMVNGSYLVLCEEDEKAFLEGKLDLDVPDKVWDSRSKKALTEECLKDFYTTDDYSENDEVYEIFEPIIEKYFEITNEYEDTMSISSFRCHMQRILYNEKQYRSYFGVRGSIDVYSYKDIDLNPYSRDSQFWKFKKYLEGLGITKSSSRDSEGRKLRVYRGIKAKYDEFDSEFYSDLDDPDEPHTAPAIPIRPDRSGGDTKFYSNPYEKRPNYDDDKYNNCI